MIALSNIPTRVIMADPKLRRSLREKSCEANDPLGDARRPYDGWGRTGGVSQACYGRREQQFCRSASARLPRTRHPADDDDDDDDYAERSSEQDSRDGERKIQQVRTFFAREKAGHVSRERLERRSAFQREESMKRLLEWKQRMLQSPLTRKPSNRARAQNDLSSYYKQQALLDLAAHEAAVAESRHSRRREDRPHVRSKSSDGRRTAANVSRYNSYSSDDEGRDSSPELII